MNFYTFIAFFITIFVSTYLFFTFIGENCEVIQSRFQHAFWCKTCNKFVSSAEKAKSIKCPKCGDKCTLARF